MLASLSNQCNILTADDPCLNSTIPGDLHVLAIGLERLQHLYFVAFLEGSQRASKNVVLLHVVLHSHLIIFKSLLRAYKLIAQVEELFQAFASQDKFRLSVRVTIDPQYRVAPADILDQKREHGVHLVLGWPLHIELEVDKVNVINGTPICDGFDDRGIFDLQCC